MYHQDIISFTLKQAINRLNSIRLHNPRAGGLIVASSIHHAMWIKIILSQTLKQSAVIVTHEHPESHHVIDNFESDCSTGWIISIGMVSEGTNIPRLQVCCYLTRVKTELYFRQVLGRIVRSRNENYRYAYLYTLAENTLLEYAKRIGQDLPDELATVNIEPMDIVANLNATNENMGEENLSPESAENDAPPFPSTQEYIDGNSDLLTNEEPIISIADHNRISLSGQFSEELIMLQNAFNRAC